VVAAPGKTFVVPAKVAILYALAAAAAAAAAANDTGCEFDPTAGSGEVLADTIFNSGLVAAAICINKLSLDKYRIQRTCVAYIKKFYSRHGSTRTIPLQSTQSEFTCNLYELSVAAKKGS
jgi:hypothetical protein